MTDFERWLRATMSAAADGSPPAGLMAGIRRRRRRHLVRAGAWCGAVVVALALAVPLALHAPRAAVGGGNGPAGHGRGAAPAPAPQVCPPFCGPPPSTARAAPGTVLRDCPSENGGDQEIAGYRAQSVRAGPVWFVWARDKGYWPVSRPLNHGQVQAVGVPVAVQAGATAVVRVAPAAQSRFRFLAGFNGSDRYSLHDGQTGVTFAACPASYLGPVTVFWVGYLNGGLSCVPFTVTVPGQRPIRLALSADGGTCFY